MDKFRFSSSSDIICSVQVRFKFRYYMFRFSSSSKNSDMNSSSSVQVQGSIELEPNRTEPRNTTSTLQTLYGMSSSNILCSQKDIGFIRHLLSKSSSSCSNGISIHHFIQGFK